MPLLTRTNRIRALLILAVTFAFALTGSVAAIGLFFAAYIAIGVWILADSFLAWREQRLQRQILRLRRLGRI